MAVTALICLAGCFLPRKLAHVESSLEITRKIPIAPKFLLLLLCFFSLNAIHPFDRSTCIHIRHYHPKNSADYTLLSRALDGYRRWIWWKVRSEIIFASCKMPPGQISIQVVVNWIDPLIHSLCWWTDGGNVFYDMQYMRVATEYEKVIELR